MLFIFILGILIILPVSQTESDLRYVGLAGFLLSAGSYIVLLYMIFPIGLEVKARYIGAAYEERKILEFLFYFSRGVYLWIGIFALALSLLASNNIDKVLIEINGEISSIEVVGTNNPNLRMELNGYSNRYGIATFKIPDEKFQRIVNDLGPEKYVYLMIDSADEAKHDDPYIQIYGIRTETFSYLTSHEYRESDSRNNLMGIYLGIIFTFLGLSLLVYSWWEMKKISKLNIIF